MRGKHTNTHIDQFHTHKYYMKVALLWYVDIVTDINKIKRSQKGGSNNVFNEKTVSSADRSVPLRYQSMPFTENDTVLQLYAFSVGLFTTK